MTESLPVVYLSFLLIILGGLGVFVFSQVLKARRLENTFGKLQKKLQNGKGTAQEYYQLGSIYLDKKLYSQSINLFQKALKMAEEVEPENQALIYNAMGYACFAQEQFDLAIRHYKDALKLYPDYVIALNNLANVYEKKQMVSKALETYEQTLAIEPNNKVAQRRANSLKKRLVET
ncbi:MULTISPECIES: tetratricopeptide repeat protein [unclassified Synechocystis]|uniref:tetratricopeptide repeat protein n=1 Tax=unclassified Synechocystis TaxID=2640012 RepID=UPI0003F65E3B|nr:MULTISPECIES: tetratricopeptide repeat protein [unclassified Synechocystis]AIE74988.1 photosystem I assembly related protein Ycf37 [Synechocystis sp. PCC 6714]MCT0253304.1 tetratricopeptide repeat protein [Synechocystis sp. CS-94]